MDPQDSFKLLQKQSPHWFLTFFQIALKTTIPEILSNYCKDKIQGISEFLSNYFKNKTRDPRDSFKLLQKQNTRSLRDSSKLLQKQSPHWSLTFFQITLKTRISQILSKYCKDKIQWVSEFLSNYFKNKTRDPRDFFKILQKQNNQSQFFFSNYF